VNQLPALTRVFAYLSLLTVGGGMAAFPELKTLTVNVHKWLTLPQLIHLYSVGQMAPGPKMMMIVPIGEWVEGTAGAVVVLLAFFGPPALLADHPASLGQARAVALEGPVPTRIGCAIAVNADVDHLRCSESLLHPTQSRDQ
jgi:hypothetical protein